MIDDDARPDAELPSEEVAARLAGLARQLDTLVGAVAALASTQADLLRQTEEFEGHRNQDALDVAQRLDALERQVLQLATQPAAVAPAADGGSDAAALRDDVALVLDVLARVAESLERSDAQAEDRMAALRDAAAVPMQDLQALLTARVERSDAELSKLTERLGTVVDLLAEGRTSAESGGDEAARSAARVDAAADRIGERVEELGAAVQSLSWQLPEIGRELGALRERVEGIDPEATVSAASQELDERLVDLGERVTSHTNTAIASLLRLVDERLGAVRDQIEEAAQAVGPTAQSAPMGFEAGAVMGAAQAAWTRLEQRIDTEFDDLGRQLEAMAVLIERALATAEAAANRPVVTGEQLRGAATTVKDTILGIGRTRRDRRGGPRSLGPG